MLAGIWWVSGEATVPKVTGLTQEQAAVGLEAAGLGVGRTSEEPTLAAAPGTVMNQMPKPGTSVREGTTVDLVVASVPSAAVPDVVGMPSSEAEAELAIAGLRVGEVDGVTSNETPEGEVLAQSPEADTEVPVASEVALEISTGPKEGAVPDVTGLPSVDAVRRLRDCRVCCQGDEEGECGRCRRRRDQPVARCGDRAQEGATVTITVSKGAPPTDEPATSEAPATTEPPRPPNRPRPRSHRRPRSRLDHRTASNHRAAGDHRTAEG